MLVLHINRLTLAQTVNRILPYLHDTNVDFNGDEYRVTYLIVLPAMPSSNQSDLHNCCVSHSVNCVASATIIFACWKDNGG